MQIAVLSAEGLSGILLGSLFIYNGDLTSKQAGSVGGQMVKKMVESYENNLKTNG